MLMNAQNRRETLSMLFVACLAYFRRASGNFHTALCCYKSFFMIVILQERWRWMRLGDNAKPSTTHWGKKWGISILQQCLAYLLHRISSERKRARGTGKFQKLVAGRSSRIRRVSRSATLQREWVYHTKCLYLYSWLPYLKYLSCIYLPSLMTLYSAGKSTKALQSAGPMQFAATSNSITMRGHQFVTDVAARTNSSAHLWLPAPDHPSHAPVTGHFGGRRDRKWQEYAGLKENRVR